jgi:UDP-3-O-[3-hydroxymyristoyl] glucosamine N-acyltransferase
VTARTLAELAALVGGEVTGDGSLRIDGVAPLEEAGPGQVSFFANKKYRAAFESTRAGAVVVGTDLAVPPGRTVVRSDNPYLAFAKLSTWFHPGPVVAAGISPQAAIDPTASIDPSAQVGPLVSVGAGAVVGARTILSPGVQLGAGARVGADTILYSNVVVRDGCVVGNRVILQPGVVIGGDGFGFATDLVGDGASGPRHFKIPQAGVVVIEDDVEIGANSCVDRAALGVTRIGRGTKIDNLVQIGHGVEMGPLCIVAAGAGIAGSTRLGMGVVVWGQAGVTGHLVIGDRANISAQSGVMRDLAPGERVAGTPAIAEKSWARAHAAMERFNEMRHQMIELKRRVARLDGGGEKEES